MGFQRLYRAGQVAGEQPQRFQDAERRLALVRVRTAVRLDRFELQRQIAELELGTGLELDQFRPRVTIRS
ncbi:hypothetical protein [Nonomuraea aurantiaca]|uniref:hypothetical protein n=1 Tax=Nonomuraea aurantiaca TaxID=2878562 RepID=UPI001CDA0992|nr:hypothetical protein [Nonomuraea aurantiaca]MCA2227359.1 hypothetical protein [Nonomuraea aurantiaca]